MGGYMGFGMATWIYKQRLRKPFSTRRSKPSCNTLPVYTRKFKLQPSKKSSNLYIIFSFLLIALIITGILYKGPVFMEYSNGVYTQKQKQVEQINNEAFHFLINSGLNRLRDNNIVGAYSEFQLAYDIYPKDEKLNQLLIETLSILCKNENKYCKDLNRYLESSL